MRVVIDACMDPRVVQAFAHHDAQTLFDLGWQHLKDDVLIRKLDCDVFVTADRGFEHQHNLKALPFGIVIVHVNRNQVRFYRPLFSRILKAAESVTAGAVVHIYESDAVPGCA